MSEEIKPVPRRTRTRDIMIGLVIALVGLVMLPMPLVLGIIIGRFFVVAGFLAICGGVGIVLNTLLDKRGRS